MSNLVYFTFFYTNIDIEKLLLCLKLFTNEVDFLVLTNSLGEKIISNICKKLDINNLQIKLVELNSPKHKEVVHFEIFEKCDISKYDKILFFDENYFISSNISEMFKSLQLDNMECLSYYFDNINNYIEPYSDIKLKVENKGGVMVFKNCNKIKELFSKIINSFRKKYKYNEFYQILLNSDIFSKNILKNYISDEKEFKFLTDKKFLNIQFIRDRLNNLNKSYLNVVNKKFNWKHDCINPCGFIKFLENNQLETTWCKGNYKIHNNSVEATWNGISHTLIFDKWIESFISLRNTDNHISTGNII